MEIRKSRKFANGIVYAMQLQDGYPIEVTDTFLPYSTKDAATGHSNCLESDKPEDLGSRSERWMIGVSVSSGCVVGCKFCATGSLPKFRNLTADEIVEQVEFVVRSNPDYKPSGAKEFKINYTRMGEPFLNIAEVRKAISVIDARYPGTHHYISTIGIRGSDFSWIKDNITLQLSLHSLDSERRDDLIPFKNKLSIAELGAIRTESALKTTLNLTLVDEGDFDIGRLTAHFPPENFFVKLSPVNPNAISEANGLGKGIIKASNLL